MATITITAQPLSEIVAGGEEPTTKSVTATYDGEETLLYQWYKCADAEGTDPEIIELGVTNELTFGTMTPGYTTWYYCRLSALDVASPVLTNIVYVTQNGLLPAEPEYLTGAFVLDYIGQCSADTQVRFEEELARTGITFADSTAKLRTEQIELFARVI